MCKHCPASKSSFIFTQCMITHFLLNSTSNWSVTPATSLFEHVHHFLIGEKLSGGKEKIKK